jgi:hypothetical protein
MVRETSGVSRYNLPVNLESRMLTRPVPGYDYKYRPIRESLGQDQGLGPQIQRLVDSAKSAIESRIRAQAEPMIIKAAVLGVLGGFAAGIILGPAIRDLLKIK